MNGAKTSTASIQNQAENDFAASRPARRGGPAVRAASAGFPRKTPPRRASMFSESRAASVSGNVGTLSAVRPAARFFSFPPCPASATIRPVRATAGPPASARADKRTFRKREDVDSGNVGTFLTVRLFGFARRQARDPLSVHPRLPTASRKTETPGRAPSFAWSRKTIWKKSVHEGQMQILRIRTFGSRRRRRKHRSVQPLQQAFRRQVPGGAFDIPAGSRRTAEPKSVVRLSNGGRSRQTCNDHAETEDELLSLLRAARRSGRPVLLQLRDASVGSKTGPTGRGQEPRASFSVRNGCRNGSHATIGFHSSVRRPGAARTMQILRPCRCGRNDSVSPLWT